MARVRRALATFAVGLAVALVGATLCFLVFGGTRMSSPQPPSEPDRSRRRAFIALLAVCLLLGGGFVAWAAVRDDDGDGGEAVTLGTGAAGPTADGSASTGDTSRRRGSSSSNVKRDAAYAHMALLPPDGQGRADGHELVCERAHFSAGRGLCLLGKQGVDRDQVRRPGRWTTSFQRRCTSRRSRGILSRARVSPDGRYGATTAFVAGHSYADVGKFSTSTKIIDMASGKELGDLEDFEVTKDGKLVDDVRPQLLGRHVRRGQRPLLRDARHRRNGTWLIEGSVSGRSAHTLHENVECPSLSPDGKRIAYKKRGRRQAGDAGGSTCSTWRR